MAVVRLVSSSALLSTMKPSLIRRDNRGSLTKIFHCFDLCPPGYRSCVRSALNVSQQVRHFFRKASVGLKKRREKNTTHLTTHHPLPFSSVTGFARRKVHTLLPAGPPTSGCASHHSLPKGNVVFVVARPTKSSTDSVCSNLPIPTPSCNCPIHPPYHPQETS